MRYFCQRTVTEIASLRRLHASEIPELAWKRGTLDLSCYFEMRESMPVGQIMWARVVGSMIEYLVMDMAELFPLVMHRYLPRYLV